MKQARQKSMIIFSLILLVIIILFSTFIYVKRTYLFMPYEYPNSQVFWPKWHDLKKPIQLEYCKYDDGWNCVISKDEDEIKYLIESFKDVTFAIRSRGEFREIELPNDYGMRYNVNLRIVEKIDENGIDHGSNIFTFDVYENFNFIRMSNSFYYYYEIPDDLREHILNQDYTENN